MSSLFECTSGVQTFGEYKFEWLPLHKTPCFGVSGPNACYSSTCDHNPTQNGSKYPKSTKTIVNRNPFPKEQIRATSTPFEPNTECIIDPVYYACEAKLSPTFYYNNQAVSISDINQIFQNCNGLKTCPMISMKK